MAASNTAHKIPTVTEIVSDLNLQLRTQEKLAGDESLNPAGRLAALARAEQISHLLHTITGNREWEQLMMRFRQEVSRTGYRLVEKPVPSRDEVRERIATAR